MKNAELANLLCFATKTEIYGGSMTMEPCGLIDFLNPVSVRLGGVLHDLVVNALSLKALFVCQEGRSKHEQQAVQQTVYSLETRRLSAEAGGEISLITGFALLALIFEAI